MKYAFLAASVASMMIATPALAQTPTVVNQQGQHLDPHITADDTGPTDDAVVYGTTGVAAHDVQFTSTTGSIIDITDGGGFAQINDIDYAVGGSAALNNTFSIDIDVLSADFDMYKFSLMLAGESYFNVYYALAGGAFTLIDTLFDDGNGNTMWLVDSDGLAFDKLRIETALNADGTGGYGAAIFQLKQNSINLLENGNEVPEPSTWAMMLLGFGAAGYSMRRSRKARGMIRAIA